MAAISSMRRSCSETVETAPTAATGACPAASCVPSAAAVASGEQPEASRQVRRERPATGSVASTGLHRPRRARPVSAPCCRPEFVASGTSSSCSREMRARVTNLSAASSTKKLLDDALQKERATLRPWFKRHHVTVGVANAAYPPESREYFDVPRPVELDMDTFAAEFLFNCGNKPCGPSTDQGFAVQNGPARWHQNSTYAADMASASQQQVNAEFAWKAPEEVLIAQALHRLGKDAAARAERPPPRARNSPTVAAAAAAATAPPAQCGADRQPPDGLVQRCWSGQQGRGPRRQSGGRKGSSSQGVSAARSRDARLRFNVGRGAASRCSIGGGDCFKTNDPCRITTLKVPTSAYELRGL